MSAFDPTSIEAINAAAQSWAGPRERIHPVAIERLVVGQDALAELPELVAERAGGPVLLVMDSVPMRRGGEDLKAKVESALRARVELTALRLPAPVHCDLPTAERLARTLPNYRLVVSLGSGTVTDLVKYARHVMQATALLPYFVAVPTAASMTAYTSSLGVLMVDGVKRTLPARPPDVVVCDLPTLAEAPPALTRAGFGDVLARSVAYGDWYLAGELGMAEGFSDVPGRLVADAETRMIAQAADIGAARPEAVGTLMEALLLSGMAMSLVNQTAPLSGWEHVISHFLDLAAAHDRRPMALHGEQVGVGTLLAARAYERAWPGLHLERLLWEPSNADLAAARKLIEKRFRPYDTTGKLVEEIWRDAERKLRLWQASDAQHRTFVERKAAGELDGALTRMVRPAAEIEAALTAAGAPRRFEDLSQPVPRAQGLTAVRYGHLIRARFTLGDLLDLTGWLTEANAEALLEP